MEMGTIFFIAVKFGSPASVLDEEGKRPRAGHRRVMGWRDSVAGSNLRSQSVVDVYESGRVPVPVYLRYVSSLQSADLPLPNSSSPYGLRLGVSSSVVPAHISFFLARHYEDGRVSRCSKFGENVRESGLGLGLGSVGLGWVGWECSFVMSLQKIFVL